MILGRFCSPTEICIILSICIDLERIQDEVYLYSFLSH